jgi:hypothetical protein
MKDLLAALVTQVTLAIHRSIRIASELCRKRMIGGICAIFVRTKGFIRAASTSSSD